MTEKQTLRLKPAPRLEQVSHKFCERMQDRKHRPNDSPLQSESRPDGIFGKGKVEGAKLYRRCSSVSKVFMLFM